LSKIPPKKNFSLDVGLGLEKFFAFKIKSNYDFRFSFSQIPPEEVFSSGFL
jgi:hypothetical protein